MTNSIKTNDFYFNLFIELRKEIIESQKIRAQVIGFKITFVSAGIGVIIANLEKVPPMLLAVPAFAAIFFDFLIDSYSFSIKRIGSYCRNQLEPYIRQHCELDKSFLLWEQFMHEPGLGQIFATVGNLGLTFLAVVPAIIGVWISFPLKLSLTLISILLLLLTLDIRTVVRIGKIGTGERDPSVTLELPAQAG